MVWPSAVLCRIPCQSIKAGDEHVGRLNTVRFLTARVALQGGARAAAKRDAHARIIVGRSHKANDLYISNDE
jgi:hypothetical protein